MSLTIPLRYLYRAFGTLALVITFLYPAAAQQLTGKVVDKTTNAPLIGASAAWKGSVSCATSLPTSRSASATPGGTITGLAVEAGAAITQGTVLAEIK